MKIAAPLKLIAPYDLTTDGGITRPAAKNVYDSAGTLVTVAADQVAISFDPSDLTKAPWVVVEPASTNLLTWSEGPVSSFPTNGGVTDALPITGFARALQFSTGQNYWAYKSYSPTVGSTYTLSVVVQMDDGLAPVPSVDSATGDFCVVMQAFVMTTPSKVTSIGGGRYIVESTFTTQAIGGGVNWGLVKYGTQSGRGFRATAFQLEPGSKRTSYWPTPPTFVSRASTGTYYDAAGLLQTAAINAARMTYDPNNLSAPPYLMVEGAATNYAPNSETFGAGWGGSVAVSPSAAAYRGRPYKTLTKTTAATSEYMAINPGIPITAGIYMTVTVALRAGSTTVGSVGIYDWDTNTWGALADASATILEGPGVLTNRFSGALFDINGLSTTVDTLVKVTRRHAAPGHTTAVLYPGSPDSVTIGHSILATRVQFEDGLSATSYMPNATNAPVIRAADVVSYSQTRAADVVNTGAFVYSNLPETDYAAWAAGTPYVVGNRVVRSHHIYEALQNSTGADPVTNAAGDTPKWLDLGATNQRACLDQIVGAASSGADRLFFVLRPGKFSSTLALLNVDANDVRVSVVDENGIVRYQRTVDLRVKKRTFTDWFFKPVERKSSAVFDGLPFYSKGLITVTVTKVGSTASVGEIVIGRSYQVGSIQWAPEIRGLRYSKITTDDFGRTTFLKRRDAKEITADVLIDNDVVEESTRVLDTYTTEPVVFFTDVGGSKFGGLLTALGFISDYRTVLKSPAGSLVNIKIQGFV